MRLCLEITDLAQIVYRFFKNCIVCSSVWRSLCEVLLQFVIGISGIYTLNFCKKIKTKKVRER
jgi:hypothetical protein